MMRSKIIGTMLGLGVACAVSACGPSSDCKCAGRDVNASVWGTAEGELMVAGYDGLERGLVKTSNGSGFGVSELFDVPLWRGWGTSLSDYWLVGGSVGRATVIHRTGGSALTFGVGSGGPPLTFARGIWGSGNDSMFVVGTGGAIAHFDGSVWARQESPVAQDLHDVWGTADDDVFAVGSAGALLHFDGSSWRSLEPPPELAATASLNAVWGSSAEDVFVVGEAEPEQSHVILHYDGVAFRVVHEGDRGLLGVHGAGPGRVVAVGGKRVGSGIEAEILSFDGSDWTEVPSSAGTFLWDVWVDADGSGYTVVGPEDTILHQAF
jgi:hypothetical protein